MGARGRPRRPLSVRSPPSRWRACRDPNRHRSGGRQPPDGRSRRRRGDDRALTVDDRSWTFAELRLRSLRAASHLARLGTKHGDIVAFPMLNSFDQTALFFGAWRLGATPLPLPAGTPDHELEAILKAAGTTLVVRSGDAIDDEPLWDGEPRGPEVQGARHRGAPGSPRSSSTTGRAWWTSPPTRWGGCSATASSSPARRSTRAR